MKRRFSLILLCALAATFLSVASPPGYEVVWKDRTVFDDLGAAWHAPNATQGFDCYFLAAGVRITPVNDDSWRLDLGYAADGSAPRVDATRVAITRAGRIVEWFDNRPEGLEHGFTVFAPEQEHEGTLTLDLAVGGTLIPVAGGGRRIDFVRTTGQRVLRYDGLTVWDRTGRELNARLEVNSAAGKHVVSIVVDTAGALYPLTIDPLISSPVWTGKPGQAPANYGLSVSGAGDVDNDGYDDVIVGANSFDNGEFLEGRAFLYLGSAGGPSAVADWTAESDTAGAYFGWSVDSAGDVNGDGFDDVIVGASEGFSGDGGFARVYHGSAVGLSPTADWSAAGSGGNVWFGHAVASAGDVDDDGFDDVVIGAVRFDNGEGNEGRVSLYPGSATGLDATASWNVESNEVNLHLGAALAGGDVNGDGFSDVIVGSDAVGTGRVFVYHGGPGGPSLLPDWSADAVQPGSDFGFSVAAADVNGDGIDDLIVGAPQYDASATNQGRAYAYLGSPAGLSAQPDWIAELAASGARLGDSVGSVGDIDTDGYEDVLVGAPGSNSVLVFHGSAAGLYANPTSILEIAEIGGFFGGSVDGAGDVDDDGFDDVIVGAHAVDPGGTAYVYLGAAPACVDADGDGYPAGAPPACPPGLLDCDDANPGCGLDCTDADGDGTCVDQDCDDADAGCATGCDDSDGDGLTICDGDCDDTNAGCRIDCTDLDGDGWCVTLDCDDLREHCNVDCTDLDGDDYCAAADCDETSSRCGADCRDLDADGARGCDADCNDFDPECSGDCSSPRCAACPADPTNQPLQLNVTPVPGGIVAEFAISPTGEHLVYRASQNTPDHVDLYSTPIGGGPIVKLNPPLAVGGNVDSFEISADGARVVYRADQNVDGEFDLYVVPIEGGSPTLLATRMLTRYRITPDNGHVVYRDHRSGESGGRIFFSVPIGGGVPVPLDPGSAFDVGSGLLISADSNAVVFSADDFGISRIWKSDLTGDVIQLVDFLDLGFVAAYAITPDSERLIYGTGTNISGFPMDESLSSIRLDGGGNTSFAGGPLGTVRFVGVTPEPIGASHRIVYVDEGALKSSDVAGGSTVVLDPSVFGTIRLALDRVLFRRAGSGRLFSVPVSGGAAVDLTGPFVIGGEFEDYDVGSNAAFVLYRADQDVADDIELFAVPAAGGSRTRVNGPLVASGDVTAAYGFNAFGTLVAYVADQDADERFEIYAASVGGGQPLRLNAPPGAGQDVAEDFVGSSDGRYLVYRQGQDLFSVAFTTDADADGALGGCDCARSDATLWRTPGEVRDLRLDHSGGPTGITTLSWSAPAEPGGTATLVYDTLRAAAADGYAALSIEPIECVQADDDRRTSLDAQTPEFLFYYLVRAGHACGEGALGTGRVRGGSCEAGTE